MWIMSFAEFVHEANQNKNGKNIEKRSIWFNGKRKDKATGKLIESPYPRFDRYRAADFSRFRSAAGLVAGDPDPTEVLTTSKYAAA